VEKRLHAEDDSQCFLSRRLDNSFTLRHIKHLLLTHLDFIIRNRGHFTLCNVHGLAARVLLFGVFGINIFIR